MYFPSALFERGRCMYARKCKWKCSTKMAPSLWKSQLLSTFRIYKTFSSQFIYFLGQSFLFAVGNWVPPFPTVSTESDTWLFNKPISLRGSVKCIIADAIPYICWKDRKLERGTSRLGCTTGWLIRMLFLFSWGAQSNGWRISCGCTLLQRRLGEVVDGDAFCHLSRGNCNNISFS